MLTLHSSNRLERLSRSLAGLLREPAGTALQPEWVVVQHPGMARWLSLEVAGELGICANLRFPLPAAFIWQVFRACLDEVPDLDPFQPGRLAWRLHALLGEPELQSRYRSLGEYLQGGDTLRRFQLAQQLAVLFDRYLIYRPDWIQAWELHRSAQAGDEWQADLWRDLNRRDEVHWVNLQQRFFALDHPPVGSDLPARVCLFGVPTLSPGYLEIIRHLSAWIDVHLFLLNPCEAHWAEIVPAGTQARLELRHPELQLYLEVGHPLLASLASQGRDFFAAINELDPGSETHFEAAPGEHLLQRLQNQIRQLQTPTGEGGQADDSIAIHRCHSPMREVEVLYDQLLAMLEETPGLAPADILVMTPEIDRYAPFVEAVFGEPGDRPRLPFRISDRSLQQTNSLATALLEILRLPGSRYRVGEMLSLLEITAVRRRFGLDEVALASITDWIAGASIRWGRDGDSKAALDLPVEERNTWRAGLRQLLLGYAMPAGSDALWRGIHAVDAAEGSTSAWLGGLLAFCDTVFGWETQLQSARSLGEWERCLMRLSEDFFLPDEAGVGEADELRQLIHQLAQEGEESGFQGLVPLGLVRYRLQELMTATQSRGFLGGGINFCALAPQRSLPFRVICLLGMNDGAFPRRQPEYGFDLMAGEFRMGDRSRRVDDRYLFLETLISARDRLYLSYVGRSQRDSRLMPPSVVVDELSDTLRLMIGDDGLSSIIHNHPLQPFSPDYFQADGKLFSYSPERREAAMRVGTGSRRPQPLLKAPLEDLLQLAEVNLEGLLQFYANPPRAFAQKRLQLSLASAAELPDEREPFALARFERLDLERHLVARLLQGDAPGQVHEVLDAAGRLPHGLAGRLDFEQMLARAQPLVQRLEDLRAGQVPFEIELDLSLDGVQLTGRLREIVRPGLLSYDTAPFYPYQLLQHWLRHLLLNLASPAGVELRTWLLEGERTGSFRPLDDPREFLKPVLHYFRQGHLRPLPFYPATSWAYVAALDAGDEAQALQAARNKWFGNQQHEGDSRKPYNLLLWPDGEIFGAAFARTAVDLLGPLMDHLEWQ